MIKRIAHVGIATHSIAESMEFYKYLGLEVDSIEIIRDQKVKMASMKVGNSAIELIEAIEEDSPVERFIETCGGGIHHITFEVDDLRKQLKLLKDKNIRLIDEKPRRGAGGSLIAFIHPRSTGGVLVELAQIETEETS